MGKVDRGVLTQMTQKAVKEAGGLPVYYTEWNSGAGIASDGPFGSSFILKTIMDSVDLAEGYSYWTFSDIFEEGGMPYKPFHGGFGLLNLQGIPKASYRAFQLLNKLGDERYVRAGAQGTVDVYGVRKNACQAVQFLAVNHHSLLHEIREEEIEIRLTGAALSKLPSNGWMKPMEMLWHAGRGWGNRIILTGHSWRCWKRRLIRKKRQWK